MEPVDINVNRVVIIFSVNLYKLLIPKDIYFGIIFLPILGTKSPAAIQTSVWPQGFYFIG